MSTVIGKYVKRFIDANIACVDDASLDAHYPEYFFDVVRVTAKTIVVIGHNGKKKRRFVIKNDGDQEYAEMKMQNMYNTIFGMPAFTFRISPFKGEVK